MHKIPLLITLLMMLVMPACKKSGGASPKIKIAYIYGADSLMADGVAFKTLLEANAGSVTLVAKANAATFNYATFDLIVIDATSATFGTSNNYYSSAFTNWSTADSAAIQGSDKPLLLMGLGGMLYGNRIQGPVNYETGTNGVTDTVQVEDQPSSLLQNPLAVTLPANRELTLYTSPSEAIEMYYVPPVTNITVLAGNTYGSFHYGAIGTVSGGYGFWGFQDGVGSLTAMGRAFLVDFVYYLPTAL